MPGFQRGLARGRPGREAGVPERAFDVKYEGSALEDGRMPVRDLAPALLALGEIFAEAGKVVHPDAPAVSLKIEAAPHRGSFIVDLVVQGLDGPWDQMADMASGGDIDALGKLVNTVLGYAVGVAGLIEVIKFLKGKLPTAKESLPEGHVKLTDAEGNSITVPIEVERLLENRRIQKSARAVVEPLTRDGVERVDFRVDSEVRTSVTKADVPAFAPPEPTAKEPEPEEDQVINTLVEIVSPSLYEGYKWRLTMGGSTPFLASIEDEAYLRRIRERETSFSAGDRLRCALRISQNVQSGKLVTDYAVLEVKEHLKVEPQTQFQDTGEAA